MLFAAVLACAASSAFAQTAAAPPAQPARPDAPPVEAYGRLPYIDLAALSPDGTKVAFIRNLAGGRELMVRDPFGNGFGGFSAALDYIKPEGLTWLSSDSIAVDFLFSWRDIKRRRHKPGKDEQDKEQDEGPVHEIAAMKLFRGVPVNYTSDYVGERLTSTRGANGGPLITVEWEHGAYHLVEYDLKTLKHTRELDRQQEKVGKEVWDAVWFPGPDGRVMTRILVREIPEPSLTVQVRDSEDPKAVWRTVWSQAQDVDRLEDSFAPVGFGEDASLLMGVRRDKSGRKVLASLDLKTGQFSDSVFAVEGRDVEGAIHDPYSDRLLGAYWVEDGRSVKWFDPEMAALQDKAEKMFSAWQLVRIASWSRDRKRLLIEVSGDRDPGSYWVYEPGTGRTVKVEDQYPMVPSTAVAQVKPYAYKARDGLAIPAYLTLPPGRPAKALPLIVMPHGGPAARDIAGFDFWAQALALRGYAVLQPNYRGSSGYGFGFEKAGWGEWGGKMKDDLVDGVKALADQGLIDPSRVCIVGASYGGYAALAGAAFSDGVYRCAVSVAGVSDLVTMQAYDSGPKGAETRALRYWRKAMGSDATALQAQSPFQHADRIRIPVLLLHGNLDTTVPIEQSRAMRDALNALKKAVVYKELANEDHHLSYETTRTEMLRQVIEFLGRENPAG
jgi:dipeptidyl aminopeptidase/acylaminoacyl peptidase